MKLTQKQENFALDVFSDVTPSKAYLTHYKCKPSASYSLASRLLTNAKVQARIQELRQKAEDDSVANVLERQQRLTAFLREDNYNKYGISRQSNIAASDQLNKMDKLYTDGNTVNVDNRKVEIIVRDKETKELVERLVSGEFPSAKAD